MLKDLGFYRPFRVGVSIRHDTCKLLIYALQFCLKNRVVQVTVDPCLGIPYSSKLTVFCGFIMLRRPVPRKFASCLGHRSYFTDL